jgi:hypothetical protein
MAAFSPFQTLTPYIEENGDVHSLHPSKETQAQAPETWFGMA